MKGDRKETNMEEENDGRTGERVDRKGREEKEEERKRREGRGRKQGSPTGLHLKYHPVSTCVTCFTV
jgi:hypothetical protein